MQTYTISRMSTVINLPDTFIKLKSMEDDPPFSAAYGYENEASQVFAMLFPIQWQNAMSYDCKQAVIDGIHQALGDDQGLIEVNAGTTESGRRFIYSIVKTVQEAAGVQYCLTMHIDCQQLAISIQGFFSECGMTGVRDACVYESYTRENSVKNRAWNEDPYNPGYRRGILMNLSEGKEYDPLFPQHPLSEARGFVEYIVRNN